MKADLVVKARWVLPISSAAIAEGFVAIENGTIVAVGSGDGPSAQERIQLDRGLLMPAFVNAHSHLGCSFLRGENDGETFLDWLRGSVTPRVMDVVENDRGLMIRAATQALEEMIASGIGTVADSFFDAGAVDVMKKAGLRGLFFREIFGSRADDLDDYCARAEARMLSDRTEFSGSGLGYGLAPHAPYTVPLQVLTACVGWARDFGMKLSLHLAESREEAEFFAKASGPMAPIFAAGEKKQRYRFGLTPTRMLSESNLIGPESILVHAVQVDDEEVELIARSGASMVHCPSSNVGLSVGVAPIESFLRAGVNVALGTDSLASTGKLDFFEEMRLAIALQRSRPNESRLLNAEMALKMATWNGARALGLEDQIGSLEPGKAADFCLIDLSRANRDQIADPNLALVHSSNSSDVLDVFVAGRRISVPKS